MKIPHLHLPLRMYIFTQNTRYASKLGAFLLSFFHLQKHQGMILFYPFCILLLNLMASHLVVHKVTKVDWSLRTPKSLHIAFAFPKSKPSTPGVQNSKLSIIWFISRFLSKPQQNLRITLKGTVPGYLETGDETRPSRAQTAHTSCRACGYVRYIIHVVSQRLKRSLPNRLTT